jgi:hypothetical protein
VKAPNCSPRRIALSALERRCRERGWDPLPAKNEEKGSRNASHVCPRQPIGIRQGPRADRLVAFLVGGLGDVGLAIHQDLQTLLYLLTGLGEFAEDPYPRGLRPHAP